jgi:hypothetical protein
MGRPASEFTSKKYFACVQPLVWAGLSDLVLSTGELSTCTRKESPGRLPPARRRAIVCGTLTFATGFDSFL